MMKMAMRLLKVSMVKFDLKRQQLYRVTGISQKLLKKPLLILTGSPSVPLVLVYHF